jgi:hypothetical protein
MDFSHSELKNQVDDAFDFYSHKRAGYLNTN